MKNDECDNCTPSNSHDGEKMQPPSVHMNTLNGGVRIPLPKRGPAPDPRVTDMLMMEEAKTAMHAASGEPSAGFMLIINQLTRLQMELAAIKRGLEKRGVLTEREFLAAMQEVSAIFDEEMKRMHQQMGVTPQASGSVSRPLPRPYEPGKLPPRR